MLSLFKSIFGRRDYCVADGDPNFEQKLSSLDISKLGKLPVSSKPNDNTNHKSLSIATFNIRCIASSDVGNEWDKRCQYLIDYVQKDKQFDICCFQEVTPQQLDDIKSGLSSNDKYGIISRGRDPCGTGEACTIIFNRFKFHHLFSSTFWLNPNCDKQEKGWDSECIRICTYAVFYDPRICRPFIVMNTHWDHKGVIARKETPKLLNYKAKQIQNLLQQNKKLFINNNNTTTTNAKEQQQKQQQLNIDYYVPVILCGDFNVDQNSECFKTLLANNNTQQNSNNNNNIDYDDDITVPKLSTTASVSNTQINRTTFITLNTATTTAHNSNNNDDEKNDEIYNNCKCEKTSNDNNNNQGGFFANTYNLALIANNPCSSYNGWIHPPCIEKLQIDHLLLSDNCKELFKVKTWAVGNDACYISPIDKEEHYCSDHFPIHIELEWV